MVLSLIGMMAVMAAIVAMAWFAARWIAVHGAPDFAGGSADERFCVLRQINVGRSERLLLVRVGGKCFLIGVTAASMCVIAELSEEESEQWLDKPQPVGFMEALRSAASRIPKKK